MRATVIAFYRKPNATVNDVMTLCHQFDKSLNGLPVRNYILSYGVNSEAIPHRPTMVTQSLNEMLEHLTNLGFKEVDFFGVPVSGYVSMN
jgi:hypothetical protein